MEENKNMEQNVAENNEEQVKNQAPANEETPKEGIISKGKGFFKRNGKKIGMVVGGVGLVAAGVVADRFGLPLLKKKTGSQEDEATPTEE